MDPITHFQIPVQNKDRAMQFYKDIFGWEMIDMPEMQYVIARTGKTDSENMLQEPGIINGGLDVSAKDTKLNYAALVISVKSIEEKLKLIEDKGGKVQTQKTPVSDMGFFAEFIDSEGNVMGLWE